MNPRLPAHYHDGRRLAPRPVEIEFSDGDLLVHGLEQTLVQPLNTIRISDRLAHVPRFLRLPDGTSIETADNNAIDAHLLGRGIGRVNAVIHWLEQRSRIAAVATVLLVISVSAAVHFGLPALAHRGAHAVPVDIERQAGQLALQSLDRFLGPSELDHLARRRVIRQAERLQRTLQLPDPPRIEFRAMGVHPNAFALPGGILVFSDELVRIATDDELAAVLAHEIAHWRLRHGLQGLLRGSAALLLVSTVTGDLSTLTTFAGTIPIVLLQRGYSRDFEQEADDYAVEALRRAEIDPRYLASILAKLESRRGTGRQDFSYLSTHPATKDRIARIDPTGTHRELPAYLTNAPSPTRNNPDSVTFSLAPKYDVPPRPLIQLPPDYPLSRRLANEEGEVEVAYTIDHRGNVTDIEILVSPHPDFSAAVQSALATWKFEPAQLEAKPVNARVKQKFPFTLNDTEP